jgi:hypothetical protein
MGGGGSKGSSKNTIINNTINNNTIENLNKTVMNAGVDVLVKNANMCSSAVNQNNLCSVGDVNIVGGDFTYESNQSNDAKVNFSCVNTSEASSEMADTMVRNMMGELDTLSNTEAGASLNAAAMAENTSGFGSSGSSDASSANNVTNKIKNDTRVTIQNIYENNLNTNFTSDTVNECIGKTTQSNIDELGNINIEDGNASLKCVQTNTLEQVQECKQLSEALNKSMRESMDELGFTVSSDNTATSETEATSESESVNVSTGPIQDVMDGISGILNGLLAMMGLPFILSLLAVCLISSVASSIFMFMGGKPEHIKEAGIHVMNSMKQQNKSLPMPESYKSIKSHK